MTPKPRKVKTSIENNHALAPQAINTSGINCLANTVKTARFGFGNAQKIVRISRFPNLTVFCQ